MPLIYCDATYMRCDLTCQVMLCKQIIWLAPLQDIVTAHEHFNMDGFVGQFQTALQVTSPKKRMFLLDWMGVSMLSTYCAHAVREQPALGMNMSTV